MEPSDNPTRRGFLSILTGALASVPVLGGLFVALRAALAPDGSVRPEKIELCRVDEIPNDDLLQRAVSFEARRGPLVQSVSRVVFVTRDPAHPETILALSGECTHLTCPVHKVPVSKAEPGDKIALRCPCHGGAFSRTGEVLAGPPPRPLRRLRIELPDDGEGMIYLLDL